MATINKNFKIKNGLIIEGTTATFNGNTILSETASDQYILDLIGGETLVKSVSGNLSVDGAGDLSINESGLVTSIAGSYLYADGSTLNLDSEGLYDAFVAGGIATESYVTTAIGNIDLVFNTDEVSEGTTNLYYLDSRVDSHLSGGDGITYSSGTISADVAGGLHIYNQQIQVNRDTVDTWYDAAGTAATEAGYVASDLSDHISDTSTHGVTGDIVGTSDTQTLTNKTIGDTLNFVDGFGNIMDPNKITIDGTNLAVYASNDLSLTAGNGDLILSADGAAYYGSASAENELATHGYVDNAISGLDWKAAVNLLWNDPNASTTGSTGTLVIDGHSALNTADNGYRILITTGANRGIWEYADDNANWTLTRPADADTYGELIGAAVYVMEGTQFGSTSWVQGNHYSTSFTDEVWTQFSGQGSVTAGTGITVDGLEVSIDRTTVDTWYDYSGAAGDAIDDHNVSSGVHGVSGNVVGDTDQQTLTNKSIDGSNNTLTNIGNSSLTNSDIEINGYVTALGDSVTLDTDDVSEGTAKYFTDQRALDATASAYDAAGTAQGIVDALTSDDIAEGTNNLYFTDGRAKDSAADLLTNATLSNITITGTGAGLTITAENGVAGSTTDDLTEGSTNLYYTDQRVFDTISTSTIEPGTVIVNNWRKEESEQLYVPTVSTVNVHSFDYPYESAKYLVRVVGWNGGVKHSQMTEILMTVDGNHNIAITEYGTICTDESNLASFSAAYSGGVYNLTATTAVANCEIIVAATLLSWAD